MRRDGIDSFTRTGTLTLFPFDLGATVVDNIAETTSGWSKYVASGTSDFSSIFLPRRRFFFRLKSSTTRIVDISEAKIGNAHTCT